ncbi:MAG: L,D-transpeptidase family protein [Deltaproteobacteria bacterium]|nr:L,D-transpeptidase family protein [Deltaproteobacteria bacterium]
MKLLLFLGLLLASPTPDLMTPEDARQLAEVIEMPGVDRFISDQVQQKLIQEMGNKMAEWAAEGLHQLVKPGAGDPKPETKTSLKEIFLQNPQLSKQLKIEIQKRLEAWIPKQAEKTLRDVFGQNEELKEIKDRVEKVLNTSFKDQLDGLISPWYDQMLTRSFSKASEALSEANANAFLSKQVSDLIGKATVQGLQNQIRENLPSAQFAKVKEKVMGLHIVDLPNQAYGGILAASAAMHFAKAFAGMHVNLYELKRGKEVSETMLWQLRTKQYVSFNLGDFIGMVKMLGDQVGSFHWGALKQMAKWNPANQFLEKLDGLEKQLKKIDDLYDKTTGKVQEGFENVLGDLRGELDKMSREMLGPLTMKLPCLTPEGCPDLLPDILGKTPMDYLKKFYADSGLKETLKEVNKQISGGLAGAAVATTDFLHITGPVAEILKVEKIPPQNPSQDSDFDPVFLHTGEFYLPVTDVTLPGGNMKLQFTRIYRSQSEFMGALGFNWTHNFAERLLFWDSPDGSGYTYVDNSSKKFFFRQMEEGFESPAGLFLTLKEIDSGFVLEDWEGGTRYFNKEGVLAKIRNAAGEEQTLVYEDKDLLQRVEDGRQHTLQFFYQPDGLLERVEDFTGRVWKFEYNKEHELIAATSPGTPDFPKGKTTHYHYDKHRLILMMDPKGQIFLQNYYGESGENFGKVMMQKYGNETASIEARYDGLNTWVKDRRGILHLYEHDEEGHLLRRKLVKENETQKTLRQFEYNKAGLCTAEIFPSGLKIEYQWEGPKLVKRTMVARDGTKLILNSSSHPESSTISEKTEPFYQYDLWGNIISVTSADGETRKLEVNASNLVIKENIKGENRFYRYDANDNIIQMKIPERKLEVSFEYDVLDRLTAKKEILDGDHAITTRYEQDPEGHLTRFVYPMGNEDRFVYDDEGRLMQKIRGFGTLEQSVEKYEYDEDGNLVAVIDGEGNKTTYFYDPFGRNTGFRTPMGNETQYILNEEGYVVEKEQRDGDGKLLAKEKWEYKQEKIAKYFRYLFRDNPKKGTWIEMTLRAQAKQSPFESTGDSSALRPQNGIQSNGFVRDSLGRPIQIEKTKLEWDDNGRLAVLTAENGETTTYAYDAQNRLSLEHYLNGTEVRYAYDDADRLTGIIDRRGLAWRFDYNKDGKPICRHAGRQEQHFVYDGLGRLIESIDFNEPDDAGDDISARFVWDSFSHAVGESLNGRWVYKNYDKEGNKIALDYPSKLQIIRQFDTGRKMTGTFVEGKEIIPTPEVQDIFSLEEPPLRRPSRDEAGLVRQDGNFLYRYDDWGRLIEIQNQNGESLSRYTYDVFNRVARTDKEEFSYDEWETIQTFSKGTAAQSIIYADHFDTPLLLMNHSGERKGNYYYHQDRRGSVRFLSDADGKILERYDYSPFGAMEIHDNNGNLLRDSQVGNFLGYIARPFDGQTRLVNLRMRYYAPELREFITPDPLGYKNNFFADSSVFTPRNFSYHQGQGGASRTTIPNFVRDGEKTLLLDIDLFYENPPRDFSAPEMNLYAYAGGDPINNFDPLGLYSLVVDKSRNEMTLYDQYRKEIGRWESRTEGMGDGKKKSIRNHDWTITNGDTPTGTYKIDPDRVIKRSEINERARNDPGHGLKRSEIGRWPRGKGKIDNDKSYGLGKINMEPVSGNALIAKNKYRRNGFAIHGGGKSKLVPDPFKPEQGWAPTQGCVRMQNRDVIELINEIRILRDAGDINGTVEVVDSISQSFPDLNYRNQHDINPILPPFPGRSPK